jgi:hypothetical protein
MFIALKNFHLRTILFKIDVNPREYSLAPNRCNRSIFVQLPNIERNRLKVFSDHKIIVYKLRVTKRS